MGVETKTLSKKRDDPKQSAFYWFPRYLCWNPAMGLGCPLTASTMSPPPGGSTLLLPFSLETTSLPSPSPFLLPSYLLTKAFPFPVHHPGYGLAIKVLGSNRWNKVQATNPAILKLFLCLSPHSGEGVGFICVHSQGLAQCGKWKAAHKYRGPQLSWDLQRK